MRIATITATAFAAALLSGCQAADVGQACTIDITPPLASVTADFLELGKTECENLACLQSPAGPAGSAANTSYCKQGATGLECRPYCSKPCVSDGDCGDSGLQCRPVVLDETFLKSLDPAVAQKFLGNTNPFSKYCAIPLP